MHLFPTAIGLFLLVSSTECLPRVDPIAYHQSIFKHTTVAPVLYTTRVAPVSTKRNVQSEPDAKSDPLQLFMRFFNNGQLMKTISDVFDRPKQRLQAAPKVDQMQAIKIGQFNGQALQQNDAPINGQFSIDEPVQAKDQMTDSFDWKHLLLGRDGVLTSIFNEFKERHKAELGKAKPNVPQADLTPEQHGFAKLFESFLTKAKNGNFDEPLPELPFIGICNRVSCGDIYKAVDEFRKSEFFSNFQTVMSLLHDPKGLDIIGDVLANPELIEGYLNGKNEGPLPVVSSGAKTVGKTAKDEVTNEDGDFGIDFSAIEDGKPIELEKKPEHKLPLISANMDYYSSVDNGAAKVEKEEFIPDHVDVEESVDTVEKAVNGSVDANQTQSLPFLPEISESVDAVPQDYDVAIEETVQIPKQELVPNKANSTTTTRLTTTKRPITTQRPVTTTISIHTTTKRNFRIKDAYYSMYYDN